MRKRLERTSVEECRTLFLGRKKNVFTLNWIRHTYKTGVTSSSLILYSSSPFLSLITFNFITILPI